MANTILWMDGFEIYAATSQLSSFIATSTYIQSLATGYDGGLGIKISNQNNNVPSFAKIFPTPVLNSTWLIAACMIRKVNASSTGQVNIGFGTSTLTSVQNAQCDMGFTIQADGAISVRTSGSTSAVSAAGVINPDTWYHVEYRHRYGNASNGHYEIRVNGTSVMSGVGNVSGLLPRYLILGGSGGAMSATNAIWYDDFILATSTDASPAWFGVSKVKHYAPNSTSTGQWAGSDGNSVDNHLLVDDIDAASSDWVTSTAGAAQRDLYGHAAVSGSIIHAVQARAAASSDVVGVDDFSLGVKSGATESLLRKTLGQGTPVWLEGTILQNDPNTGAAWTGAAFNASLFGVKS